MKPTTTVFLSILGVTLVVWIMRGLSLLAFLPGFIIWFLVFLSIGAGVVSVVHRTIR
jgi:hypothetical protein